MSHTAPILVLLPAVAAAALLTVVCLPVATSHRSASPEYACSGEAVDFEWSLSGANRVRIQTDSGQQLAYLRSSVGAYTINPVQANWESVDLLACTGSACGTTPFLSAEIIDQPKPTREYFSDGESGLTILGGPRVVDEQRDPSYRGEVYSIRQLVDGFEYEIPAERYSPNARVLSVIPGRLANALFGTDPQAMDIEAVTSSTTVIPRQRVPKGDSLTLTNPIHPAEVTWRLYYPEPAWVIVAQRFGSRDGSDDFETSVSLYPSVAFEVNCSATNPDAIWAEGPRLEWWENLGYTGRSHTRDLQSTPKSICVKLNNANALRSLRFFAAPGWRINIYDGSSCSTRDDWAEVSFPATSTPSGIGVANVDQSGSDPPGYYDLDFLNGLAGKVSAIRVYDQASPSAELMWWEDKHFAGSSHTRALYPSDHGKCLRLVNNDAMKSFKFVAEPGWSVAIYDHPDCRPTDDWGEAVFPEDPGLVSVDVPLIGRQGPGVAVPKGTYTNYRWNGLPGKVSSIRHWGPN